MEFLCPTKANEPTVAEWSRDLKSVELLQAIPHANWLIIFSERNGQQAQNLAKLLEQCGRPFGIKVAEPKVCALKSDRSQDFIQAIQANYQSGVTQIVVALLPDTKKDRYDAIKKYCAGENGIVSQCVLLKYFFFFWPPNPISHADFLLSVRTMENEKIVQSAVTKIILQMNVKLGGQLWGVDIPMKKCMVIGLDVYHDSAQKGTSVCGFVASINDAITKYYSGVIFQRTGQELADGLRVRFQEALHKVSQCFCFRWYLNEWDILVPRGQPGPARSYHRLP